MNTVYHGKIPFLLVYHTGIRYTRYEYSALGLKRRLSGAGGRGVVVGKTPLSPLITPPPELCDGD